MKKNTAILLLFFLATPFLGTYIFLQYHRNEIRKETAAKIFAGPDIKDLVLLKFTVRESKTELSWKHTDEFEYHGHMYDIVEMHQEGDTICYSCYNDIKETKLNNEVARLVHRALGHDPVRKSQTDRLTDFFKTVFRHDAFTWQPFVSKNFIFNFSFLIFNYTSFSFSPLSPPPKIC